MAVNKKYEKWDMLSPSKIAILVPVWNCLANILNKNRRVLGKPMVLYFYEDLGLKAEWIRDKYKLDER